MRSYRTVALVCAMALATLAQAVRATAAEALRFSVRLDAAVAAAPVGGRLFVFLSQRSQSEPRFGPNWFSPEPFFGLDVAPVQPGGTRELDDRADGFPGRLSQLPRGTYYVQALLDHDFDCPHQAYGVGNFYSDVAQLELDPATSGQVELVLRHVVEPPPFDESAWHQEVVLRSQRLAAFHHREVIERAAVILPPSYQQSPQKRYPVMYIIPGFGGSHRTGEWQWMTGPRESQLGEAEFIRVFLSGQCKWGHHGYANSATNGPRGDCMVYEMIPYIDAHYRTVAAPTARFLTGHSSGGWAALWLQVYYPDFFGGVWSLAPDPVDFRDFQQVDLYARPPLSLYYDEQGQPRPIARHVATPLLWFPSFGRMDDCLGRGGQLRSFEAVFSPLGPDGLPRKLWDRTTGRIDPETAGAWQQYDIRLVLQNNWKVLGPKLWGKLHVATGQWDTFYLNGAVRLLGEMLQDRHSDAEIEIVPGRDHGTLVSRDRVLKNRRQMSEAFLRNHPQATNKGTTRTNEADSLR